MTLWSAELDFHNPAESDPIPDGFYSHNGKKHRKGNRIFFRLAVVAFHKPDDFIPDFLCVLNSFSIV